MSHMVIYRGADGSPGYHQTDEIHDAVAFVERLRNEEGVEGARIFRMEQVNFEYRPYFRVELTGAEPALSAAAAAPAVGAAAASTESAPSSDPVLDVVETSQTDGGTKSDIFSATDPAASEASKSETTPTFGDGATSTDDNGVGARRGLFGR